MSNTPERTTNNLRQQALNHLKNLYGIEEQIVEALLGKASNTLAESLKSLQLSAEANDLENTKKTAHALKGALLNLGLEELSTQAQKIEISTALDQTVINTFVRLMNDSGLL